MISYQHLETSLDSLDFDQISPLALAEAVSHAPGATSFVSWKGIGTES